MWVEFSSRPYFLGPLATVPEDRARAAALKHILQELGDAVYVDVPIATDAAGTMAYARFLLRDLLSAQTPVEWKPIPVGGRSA